MQKLSSHYLSAAPCWCCHSSSRQRSSEWGIRGVKRGAGGCKGRGPKVLLPFSCMADSRLGGRNTRRMSLLYPPSNALTYLLAQRQGGPNERETQQLQQEGMGVRLEEGLPWTSEVRCKISNPLSQVSPSPELSESSAIQPRGKGWVR